MLCTAVSEGSKGGPCSLQAAALPLAQAAGAIGSTPTPSSLHSSRQLPGSSARPPAARAAGWLRSLLTRVLRKPTPCAGTRVDRFSAG